MNPFQPPETREELDDLVERVVDVAINSAFIIAGVVGIVIAVDADAPALGYCSAALMAVGICKACRS